MKAFSEDTTKRLENFGFIQFRPGGKYFTSSFSLLDLNQVCLFIYTTSLVTFR